MTYAATLLTVVGAFIVCLGIYAGFWIWVDAREAAAQRRREAEMADAAVRRARHARRYTTDEPGTPGATPPTSRGGPLMAGPVFNYTVRCQGKVPHPGGAQ